MSGSREGQTYWKQEWDEALRAHLAAGLSTSMAAAEVNAEFGTNFSRSAAMARASREKMPRKKSKASAEAKPKVAKPKRKPTATPAQKRGLGVGPTLTGPQQPPAPAQLRCDPLKAGTFHVTQLEEGMCRYPSGEGSEITFCGLNQEEGKPYCWQHCAISFQPARPSTKPSYRPMRRS